MTQVGARDAGSGPFAVHLLDQGVAEYGDATLCQFGNVSVLIDGAHPGDQFGSDGHPSIPRQLGQLLNQQPPFTVDLLIVSHAHQDHIGCLPTLVADGTLRARWALVADPDAGWGHPPDDPSDDDGDAAGGGAGPAGGAAAQPPGAAPDARIAQLVAAMREPIRSPRTSADVLGDLMLDAVTLETRYVSMINRLEADGTRVFRFVGVDPGVPVPYGPLVQEFQGIGLNILGPSTTQVALCAARIAQSLTDATIFATGLVRGQDATADPVDLYRRMFPAVDAVDAASRLGAAVNLQSSIVRFAVGGRKLLFTGDMQFTAPGVPEVEGEVRLLRQAVRADGPYTFVKLAHHGSSNGVNAQLLTELGNPPFLGICAGSNSDAHPNPATLNLLQARTTTLTWARTDRNGRSTLTLDAAGPSFSISTGQLNDSTPPSADTTVVSPPVPPPPPPPPPPARSETTMAPQPVAAESGVPNVVEVHTWVPHTDTRVTVTIDVAPRGQAATPDESGRPEIAAPDPSRPGPIRSLPNLLFVTSRDELADNITPAEATSLLAAMRAAGLRVFDAVPAGTTDAAQVAALIQPQLRQPGLEGVVLLGGYDVVPSQRLDVLDPALRSALQGTARRTIEEDDYVVWCDDVYGDRDGMAALPVSRIPDARSPRLLHTALQSTPQRQGVVRSGVRNSARPFADPIFLNLPGQTQLLASAPTLATQQPPYNLAAERVYLMLHGRAEDATRFWGEDNGLYPEALNIGNVPQLDGAVVLSGCCWGALTVEKPAAQAPRGQPVAPRTVAASIALSTLAKGASAFVGCTGAHYSPVEQPYDYYGGPFHAAFWTRYDAGSPPARALFEAKQDYLAGIPHRFNDRPSVGRELKILRQFTCLGLGW